MAVSVPSIQSLNWSPELNNFGQVVENIDDIDQAIRIILLTPLGADPHRPDFASNIFSYLDYPQTEIKQFLIRESFESLLKWEPRIDVLNVEITFLGEEALGQVEIAITWQVKNNIQEQLSIIIV